MSGTSDAQALEAAKLVLEALPDATCVLDRSGGILIENERFEREVRKGRDEDDLHELVDDREQCEDTLSLWFGSGSPVPGRVTVQGDRFRCDGARLGASSMVLVRWQTHTDAVEAFRATSRAVHLDRLERTKTRLRQAVAEVEAANERLRSTNEELDRFASVISHDLQGALVVIKGMAKLLLEEVEGEDQREFAEAIVRNAEKMHRQIAGILAVARAGAAEPPAVPFRLEEAVDNAKDLLGRQFDESDARLELEGPDTPLPLDPSEAVQLLQNLVSNSLKFASDGEPAFVRVRGWSDGETVDVVVEDNGPGVPEDQRERVFDLFHRANQSTAGTGIGLATCRRIVERHGGSIWIGDSELGGATVRFSLPALSSTGSDKQGL